MEKKDQPNDENNLAVGAVEKTKSDTGADREREVGVCF